MDSPPPHQIPTAFLFRRLLSAIRPVRENSAHLAPEFLFPVPATDPSHPHPAKCKCSRSPESALAPIPLPLRESARKSQSTSEPSARSRSLPDRLPAHASQPAQSFSRVEVSLPGSPTMRDRGSPLRRFRYRGAHRNALASHPLPTRCPARAAPEM